MVFTSILPKIGKNPPTITQIKKNRSMLKKELSQANRLLDFKQAEELLTTGQVVINQGRYQQGKKIVEQAQELLHNKGPKELVLLSNTLMENINKELDSAKIPRIRQKILQADRLIAQKDGVNGLALYQKCFEVLENIKNGDKDLYNEVKIKINALINDNIKKLRKNGLEYKNKGNLDKALELYYAALQESEKMITSEDKETIKTRIFGYIDDVHMHIIDDKLNIANALKVKHRIRKAITTYNKALNVAHRLRNPSYRTSETSKIKGIIKNLELLH